MYKSLSGFILVILSSLFFISPKSTTLVVYTLLAPHTVDPTGLTVLLLFLFLLFITFCIFMFGFYFLVSGFLSSFVLEKYQKRILFLFLFILGLVCAVILIEYGASRPQEVRAFSYLGTIKFLT